MEGKDLNMTILLDFYGELLTGKQKSVLEMYYNDDMSLAEIAESEGITRQGVHDMLQRAEASLRATEKKTGLVRGYIERRDALTALEEDLNEALRLSGEKAAEPIRRAMDRLEKLKG